MWIKEFESLNHVKEFIINALSYEEETGFTFLELRAGMTLSEIAQLLGPANYENLSDHTQQELYYYAQIKHPKFGENEINKAKLELVTYNNDPLKVILFQSKYNDVGEDAEIHRNFIVDTIKAIQEKFGKPDKKSLRKGKSTIKYQFEYSELYIWQSFDGFKIQIQNKRMRKVINT